jgi:rod shape-determining protein MreD
MMVTLRMALVLFSALVLQTAVIADLQLFDARGDVMLLLPIAAGVVGGADRGALVGFVAGLLFDLLVQSPFGLFALTYCITGYVVGTLQRRVLRSAWWIPVLSAIFGSALGVVTFAVIGEMVGQRDLLTGDLGAIIGVVAGLNALLILPAVRVMRWSLSDSRVRLALR